MGIRWFKAIAPLLMTSFLALKRSIIKQRGGKNNIKDIPEVDKNRESAIFYSEKRPIA